MGLKRSALTSGSHYVISVLPGLLGIGCLVPLLILQVSHEVSESVKLTPVLAMFHAGDKACLFGYPRR